VPTSVWYETEDVVENVGDPTETGNRKEGIDPIFEMNVIKFYSDQPYQVDFQSGQMMLASDLPEEPASLALIEGDIIDQRRPNLYSTYKEPAASCGETVIEQESLFLMFIFGFLGGLLALLTPCVFPMIPLTVSFFTKETKKKGWGGSAQSTIY